MMNERRFIYINGRRTHGAERPARRQHDQHGVGTGGGGDSGRAGARRGQGDGGTVMALPEEVWRWTECLEANGRRGGSSDGADRLDERRELHARLLVVARFAVDRRPFAARRVLRHVHAPVLRVRELHL